MLKICGNSVCRPLKTCFHMSKFPLEWKANIVPIYEKGDKQTVKSVYCKICFTFTKLW